MSEPLLSIRNYHVPACGDPPIVSSDQHSYIGYFENAHGEQWIFTVDRETKVALLRGGDAGWNKAMPVVAPGVVNCILSAAESQWLQACWSASAGA